MRARDARKDELEFSGTAQAGRELSVSGSRECCTGTNGRASRGRTEEALGQMGALRRGPWKVNQDSGLGERQFTMQLLNDD
jgi:hypothetical protein